MTVLVHLMRSGLGIIRPQVLTMRKSIPEMRFPVKENEICIPVSAITSHVITARTQTLAIHLTQTTRHTHAASTHVIVGMIDPNVSYPNLRRRHTLVILSIDPRVRGLHATLIICSL